MDYWPKRHLVVDTRAWGNVSTWPPCIDNSAAEPELVINSGRKMPRLKATAGPGHASFIDCAPRPHCPGARNCNKLNRLAVVPEKTRRLGGMFRSKL